MKYELVFQILAYLSIHHASGIGMVSVEKTYTDTPKKCRYTDTDPPSLQDARAFKYMSESTINTGRFVFFGGGFKTEIG